MTKSILRKVERKLYDDGEYSIAWGSWDNGSRGMGERWIDGFPQSRGHPMWLHVPNHLAIPRLKSLIGEEYANWPAIRDTLDELIVT
ncbi:hypothetical protein ACFL1S_04025 [Pseudomonadota bacterium]